MATTQERVEIQIEIRVVTNASVWLIRPDRYLRLPRHEGPRRPASSAALVDGIWHAHRGVWRIDDGIGIRYRILPADRPADAHGVVTGDAVGVAVIGPRQRGDAPDPARGPTP